MGDIRQVLEKAAPLVGEPNLEAVRRGGRRRRRSRRMWMLAATLGACAAVVVSTVMIAGDTDNGERGVVARPLESIPVLTITTGSTVPGYVDPSSTDPARAIDLRRCTADDLQFSRSSPTAAPSLAGLLLFFDPNHTSACALLSYPAVEGLNEQGEWQQIPVRYEAGAPISSFNWTGVFSPDPPPPGGLGVVVRLANQLPSFFADGRCPGGAVPSRRYSRLRFVLENGGGRVELPRVEFETGGCTTVLTSFGFESRDAAGQ